MTRVWGIAVGLALVATLLAGMLVSGAQAAEFGRCLSAGGGEYIDEACTKGSGEAEGGSFEWNPPSTKFEGGLGESSGKFMGGPPLTCSGGFFVFEASGPNTGTEVTTSTGCQSEGHTCTSLNASKEGEIRTFPLEVALIEHGEKGLGGGEPAEGEVWAQVTNESGEEAPWLYKFGCTAFGFDEVGGWMSGRVTPTDETINPFSELFESGVAEQGQKGNGGCPTTKFEECFFENDPVVYADKALLSDGAPAELRLAPPAPPRVATKPATEVTAESVTLNGSVIPNGEPLTECTFEYGTTEAYGEVAPCPPSLRSGAFKLAVSAEVEGLTPDTAYHYRLSATNEHGTSHGIARTFSTLASSVSASTSESSKAAIAEDGPELRAEASGGTGEVTVGTYGEEIGGPPIFGGEAPYIDVYRGEDSTFTEVQFKDCELDGADELWWYDQASGWEPVSGALFTEGSPSCITATITETSSPSLAQLTGTRFGAVGLGVQEYGKCEPAKKAVYADAGCTKVAEKKGLPSHKGKFEWYWAPDVCFAKKKGFYSSGTCQTREEKKGKPKGTFEKGSNAFTGTTGPLKLESVGSPALECGAGTIEDGELDAEKKSTETISFSGCTRESVTCTSRDQQSGTIRTNPLEDFTFKEAESLSVFESFAGGLGLPSMSFNCGGIEYSLTGRAVGLSGGNVGVMSTKGEVTFTPNTGEQALTLASAMGSQQVRMTLTETTSGEAIEIDTSPVSHSATG